MDYEKKYKDTLEKARRYYLTGKGEALDFIKIIFPELEESEDERMKKAIKEAVEYYWSDDTQALNDTLAWLEKQGEQKPAELPKCEDYGIDGLSTAIDILQRTLGKVEGYQTDDGILEHKCAISAVKQLGEHKSAEWSEEDENLLTDTEYLLRVVKIENRSDNEYQRAENCLNWLKSLRPQPKPEWSEENDQWLEIIIKDYENDTDENFKALTGIKINFLKSLREYLNR